MDNFEEAKDYMSKREIPQLFESLMTGLMYNKPADHIQFLETCLDRAKKEEKIKWNTFLGPLPPIPQEDKPIKSETVTQEQKDDNQAHHCPEEVHGFPKEQQPLPPITKSPPVLQDNVDHSKGDRISSPDKESGKPEGTFKNQPDLETSGDGKTEEKNDDDDDKNTNNETEAVNQNITKLEHDEVSSSDTNSRDESAGECSITQPVIFVLGGPGSGKGTQCAKIVEQFKFVHLSAGDLLRAEMNKTEGSEYGTLIRDCIKEGALVPQEITIQLLRNAMVTNKDAKGFLVDGFPREIGQGVEFEEKVCKSAALLAFSCDDNVLVARLLERGKTSGRADDNEDTIKLRLKTFHEKTEPVLDYYREKVTDIDASGTVDEIYKDVEKFMEHLIELNELSEQIDSLMAEMKENPIKHEAEEEKSRQQVTENQYPQIEDEIIPSDAFLSGDRGNVDQYSDLMIGEASVGDEKDSADDGIGGNLADVAAEPSLTEEDGVVPVEVSLDGDLGNVDNDLKDMTKEKKIICVIGTLDSEMTEQCALLAEKLGFEHINIRKEVKMDAASPAEIIDDKIGNPINKLKEAILASDPAKSGFVIEGLPQDVNQGESLEAEIKSCDLLVHVKSPTQEIRQNEAEECTEAANSLNTEERVLESQREIALLANHFQDRGKLAIVSPFGSREEVFAKLLQAVEERLVESTTPAMSKELEHANIIFVLGGPGSGKGTQCAKIVEKYGFCHLSTGDLLREEVNTGSERAKKLKDIMERGELVSQEIILELLKDAMVKRKDCKGFLIDGFPRDVPQGDLFEKTVGTCKFVLYFDCSNEVMVERLLGRAKTSGRVDDNEETIKKRLKTFEDQTLPVLEKYAPQDKVRKINAERGVDDIFADVCSAIDKL